MKYADIKFVKRLEQDGVTYSWFVASKSNRVSDSRNYVNYENGKTVVKEFPKEALPKMVQKFIDSHNEEETEQFKGFNIEGFKTFIIR